GAAALSGGVGMSGENLAARGLVASRGWWLRSFCISQRARALRAAIIMGCYPKGLRSLRDAMKARRCASPRPRCWPALRGLVLLTILLMPGVAVQAQQGSPLVLTAVAPVNQAAQALLESTGVRVENVPATARPL